MHTTSIEEVLDLTGKPETYLFIHNGDYSGDINIVMPEGAYIEVIGGREHVTVPFRTLKEFVGRSLIDAAVSKLEDLSGVDYLDGNH